MYSFLNVFVVLVLALPLVGCDSGGGSATATKQSKIRGLVSDDKGPISEARIEVTDNRKALVASTELKGRSSYTVIIPASAVYPIMLTAIPVSTGPLPRDPVKAVVISRLADSQDISAVSTAIVDLAISYGGINEENMAKAAIAAIAQRHKSGGKGTSQGFKGDPTKQYGGWH